MKFKKNRKCHTESDNEDNDNVSRHVTCENFNEDKKMRKSICVKHMTQKLKNHLEYKEREDDAYVHGSSWADSEDDDESPINDESEDELFASGHPQNDTHNVRLTVDNDTIVPNFVGGYSFSSFYHHGYSGWALHFAQFIFKLAGASKDVISLCN
jgi:hypothetical protein